MSDTHEIALCIINDGDSYSRRCNAYSTMNARDFRAFALRLVNDEIKRQRRVFDDRRRYKQADIDAAVEDLIDHHRRRHEENIAALYADVQEKSKP